MRNDPFDLRVAGIVVAGLLAIVGALTSYAAGVTLERSGATETPTYAPTWKPMQVATGACMDQGGCWTPANPAWVTHWPPIAVATTPAPAYDPDPGMPGLSTLAPDQIKFPTLTCVHESCTPGARFEP